LSKGPVPPGAGDAPPSRGGRRVPRPWRDGSLRVRANDPLIYIGDRRSPPYIYRGGRFARRVGIGSDLASPAPGGTGASPAPGGTGPPASPAPGGTGWRTPITTPREGRQFRARPPPLAGRVCPVRDANPSRQGRGTRPPSDFCRFPSRVSCPPHGSREVAYYGALVEGIFAPPLTGREARPSRVPSSNSQIFEPPFYKGGSKSATCVGIVPLPPAGGRTIPSASLTGLSPPVGGRANP